MTDDKIEPSAEVKLEEAMRELQQREEEHLQANIDDHNARVDAANEFDWDAWEKETGLERPAIPKKL